MGRFAEQISEGEYFEAKTPVSSQARSIPWRWRFFMKWTSTSQKTKTQAVFDVFQIGELFAYVITGLRRIGSQRSPIFPA